MSEVLTDTIDGKVLDYLRGYVDGNLEEDDDEEILGLDEGLAEMIQGTLTKRKSDVEYPADGGPFFDRCKELFVRAYTFGSDIDKEHSEYYFYYTDKDIEEYAESLGFKSEYTSEYRTFYSYR